jgi:ribosomal protein S6
MDTTNEPLIDYELTFIVRPTDAEAQSMTPSNGDVPGVPPDFVAAVADRIEKSVVAKGGVVKKPAEYLGLRRLAYEIDDRRMGHYVVTLCDSTPDAMRKVEAEMRADKNVYRCLLIRLTD